MTRVIDPRGQMVCSLGTMIRGGVSRDHVKDAWLLRHAGGIELAGVRAPTRGTRVEFAYAWRGGLTRFPVRFYVLSASTTPYGRTTVVKVGCRLTLLASRVATAPLKAESSPPSWYSSLSTEQQQDATASIPSQTLLAQCATGLGLAIAPGSQTLTGNLLRESVSLSEGYVSVLADLLKSHCCVGYLTPGDQLMVKKVQLRGGGGPVFDRRFIIELDPINGADAGAEAVTVRYDSVTANPGQGEIDGPTPPAPVTAASGGHKPRWWGQIGSGYIGKGRWS